MRRTFSSIMLTVAVVAAGCSGAHSVAPQVVQQGGLINPDVLQKGKAPTNWTTFKPAGSGGLFLDVVVGPDKNLWFAEVNNQRLIRISMTGAVKLVAPAIAAYYLAVGADNKFYEANGATSTIGTTTTGGANKSFNVPSGDHPTGLTLGPDHNVWFVESNHVGKITKTGAITEYSLPTSGADQGAITTGADSNLWFTEKTTRKIGKVTTGGTVKEFSLPSSPLCYPTGIVKGPDNNVWFKCSSYVGRITAAGVVTLVLTTGGGANGLENMTVGPDGKPWFISDDTSIHEIDPSTLTVTNYTPPNTGFNNFTLVTGPDKNVWVGAYQNVVNVYIPNPLIVAPASIAFSGLGQTVTLTVTEHGTSAWTAATSNPNIATVVQGSSANKFDVTSVGKGTATITISDAIGNLFKVKATVP